MSQGLRSRARVRVVRFACLSSGLECICGYMVLTYVLS